MSIGSCDCCDRQNVPVAHFNATAAIPETSACFICQGEDDPDPYREMEIDCRACDGAGCAECSGFGTVWVDTQPVTLEDLEETAERSLPSERLAHAAQHVSHANREG